MRLLRGLLLFVLATVGLTAQVAPPAGLKVLTAGHSFHVWMPPLVAEMAKAAGIQGHEQLAISSIGGSKVIQHWDLPAEKNKAKPVLAAGKADLFTMAPTFLPDPGIENFAKLGLEHNPKLRLTLQQNWVPFEDPVIWPPRVSRNPSIAMGPPWRSYARSTTRISNSLKIT